MPNGPDVRVVARRPVATGRTGVEMEALTAVSVACLTVYDMVKAVIGDMRIDGIRLLEKTGGVRGDWRAPDRRNSHQEEAGMMKRIVAQVAVIGVGAMALSGWAASPTLLAGRRSGTGQVDTVSQVDSLQDAT